MRLNHILAKQTSSNVAGLVVEFFSDHDVSEPMPFSVEYKTESSIRLQVHMPHKAMTAVFKANGAIALFALPGGETFDDIMELPFRVALQWYSVLDTQKLCTASGVTVKFFSLVPVSQTISFSVEYNTETSVRLRVHTPHGPITATLDNRYKMRAIQKKEVVLPGGDTFDGIVELPFHVKPNTPISPKPNASF